MSKRSSKKGLTFHIFDGEDTILPINGVKHLNPEFTCNSITRYPTCRYLGGMANSTNWVPYGYGRPLKYYVNGGTAPTYNNGSPLMGVEDDSVKFNNKDGYVSQYPKDIRFDDEDFVIEMIIRGSKDAGAVFTSRSGGAGWYLNQDGNGILYTYGSDAVPTQAWYFEPATLVEDAWYHIIMIVNNDYQIAFYINGTRTSTAVSNPNINVYCSNVTYVGVDWKGSIAYFSMWQYPNWFPANWTEMDVFAKERFWKVAGIYPSICRGSLDISNSSFTRATAAYLDKRTKGSRRLYKCSPGWPRVAERVANNGKMLKGYLSETATTNKITYSNEGSNWTKDDAGDVVTDNANVSPEGYTTTLNACELVCDNTNGDHRLSPFVNSALTANEYTFSAFVKMGAAEWIVMRFRNITTASNYSFWFDILNGVIGTTDASVTSHMEYWGNGWWRCWGTMTCTTDNFTMEIGPADDDNVLTYSSGDGATKTLYLSFLQLEANMWVTNPVYTSAAEATRNGDLLYYGVTTNKTVVNYRGLIQYDMLSKYMNNKDTASTAVGLINTSSGNKFYSYIEINNYHYIENNFNSDYSDAVAISVYGDDNIHKLKTNWGEGTYQARTDLTNNTQKTNATNPNSINRISIGYYYGTSGRQMDGILSNIKIYGYKKDFINK